MNRAPAPLVIRATTPADRPEILVLLAQSLRWVPNDLFDAFFRWKHEENPFGASPTWVACADDRIVGFRAFLRWEFDHPDGRVRRAVRAVDTATHPDYRGRGIFRELTLHALDELRAEGVDFVFNTPNEQSRPGYLKMGWHRVGRLTTLVRPRSVRAATRMLQARVPAERWSLESSAGMSAAEALLHAEVERLLAAQEPAATLRTRRDLAYLRWRYGFAALGYRVVALDGGAGGVAVFRARRRGAAVETALCDVIVPPASTSAPSLLARAVARESNADYAIRLGTALVDRAAFVRLPGQGPILTWRAVVQERPPPLSEWGLSLGDVELF